MAESSESSEVSIASDDTNPPPKKKMKTYKQKYNSSWEREPKLKKWLAPVRNKPYNAFCKICNKQLIAGHSELLRHQISKKHQEKEASMKHTRSIVDMVVTDSISSDVKRAEIKMAAFTAEHNLPIAVMDHLSDLVKEAFPDSEIAKKFKSKRTKTRCIIKNILAKEFKTQLITTLQRQKFSIIIDETTDIASKKQLALVVRYFCDKQLSVKSQFFGLIELTQSDATTITTRIISTLDKHSIPLSNVIGYASDTTNVMFGEHNSVVSQLKSKIPDIFVMKCLCHSAHLCASHACERLPRLLEDLVRDVYSHFAHSAKRLAEYRRFQHFTSTEPHKILKPSQTRWLSLEQCVRRLLEQWEALESLLQKPIVKLYFEFLSFVLPKFTNFNKLFQSQTPNIHFLTSYLATTYKAFLSCYLSATYIRSIPLDRIDPASSANFLPLTSMNMGESVAHFLSQPNIPPQLKDDIRGFLENVLSFFVESSIQMKKRFPINDETLKSLLFLNPDTINSTSAQEVIQVARRFPNIISPDQRSTLDDEWRELQFTDPNDLPCSSSSTEASRSDIVQFWGKINKLVDTSQQQRFPLILKLTTSLLSLPHSNADVERIFSHVTNIKTKARNSMKTKTLEALIITKLSLPCSCVHFNPDTSMIRGVNREMYDSSDECSDDSD